MSVTALDGPFSYTVEAYGAGGHIRDATKAFQDPFDVCGRGGAHRLRSARRLATAAAGPRRYYGRVLRRWAALRVSGAPAKLPSG